MIKDGWEHQLCEFDFSFEILVVAYLVAYNASREAKVP